jgi:DNA polymerase-3 subunit delta'
MKDEISAYAEKVALHATINKISAIMEAREHLNRNAAPLLTIEALMCRLA